MALPSSLAGSERPASGNLARQQIERLVRQRLVGRNIDEVSFAEELLALATQVGEIACKPVANQGLRFELPGSEPVEVDVDANRGKLRMLCARLAVLCEESGHEFMPYGGEGTIRRTVKVDLADREGEPVLYCLAWRARWSNTTDKHEFTISVAR
jgi:hypothetical protein